jgi:hypothetical protein
MFGKRSAQNPIEGVKLKANGINGEQKNPNAKTRIRAEG